MGRPSKRNKVFNYIQGIREKHPDFTYQEIQGELKTVLIRRIKKDNPEFSEQRCLEELEVRDLMPSVSSIKNWLSPRNQQSTKATDTTPRTNKVWSYSANTWRQIEDPINWQVWDDVSMVLENNGYRLFHEIGNPECPTVEIYRRDSDDSYLVDVQVSTSSSELASIYIDGLPNLMDWLSRYSPIFQLRRIDDRLDDLVTMGKRAFRAWHGHRFDNYCRDCEPELFEKVIEDRLKKRKDFNKEQQELHKLNHPEEI